MSNFVRTFPFLKTALWVAMKTMHFCIAQTKTFVGTFISHPEGPTGQFGTHEKLSVWVCKVGQNRPGVIRYLKIGLGITSVRCLRDVRHVYESAEVKHIIEHCDIENRLLSCPDTRLNRNNVRTF